MEMIKRWKFIFAIILLPLLCADGFKVSYELDDRFIEYRKDAKWLVMFYAPWCHHCHKLEPIWEQVAQTFNQQQSNLGVRVGKIDATKQTKSASQFHVKGFPTIKYIHGDHTVAYEGERTREDIEEFVLKAIGPPVRRITSLAELRKAESSGKVFFLFIHNGPERGSLWDQYSSKAKDLVFSSYFHEVDPHLASGNVPFSETPSLAVYKEGRYYMYDGSKPIQNWIDAEQLPSFPKLTGSNFYQLINLGRIIVMAVVEFPANRANAPTQGKLMFDALKSIAIARDPRFAEKFSFGYLDGNEIVNSVVSEWITVPSLVAYDPLNETYFVFEASQLEESGGASKDVVVDFLNKLMNGEIPAKGGKGWFRRAYKFGYSVAAYFYKMFSTQPILSSILFGLPLGILGIILAMMYTNDCTDAPEESDTEHEKED